MKNILLLVILVFFFTVNITYSQKRHSFHFGATLPMGNFADDDIDYYIDLEEDDYYSKESGAATGVGIGYEFVYSLSEKGLGLFAGIDVNYNGLQKDIKDDIEEILEDFDIEIKDIKFPKFFNIPISAGLNYTYKADDKLSLYGNLGLLVNFIKITDYVVEGKQYDYYDDDWVSLEGTVKFDIANSFGYKVGGGIIINDKIILSINYLGLGEPEIKGEVEIKDGDSEDDLEIGRKDMPIDILTLTVGFKF